MKNEAKQIKQAEHLIEQNHLKQAAALAHRLLRRRPKSLPILERLVRLFLSAEDLYGAAEALELLRRERPVRQAPIYWLEALLAKKRRQEGRAVKAARHAIELDELSGEPLEQCYGILRDDALDYRGQIAEGVRYMKKIYELWASGGVVPKERPGWHSVVAACYTNYLFVTHYLPLSRAEHWQNARGFQKLFTDVVPLPEVTRRPPHERLRIGYISPDFRRHVVFFFCYALFVFYARERFDIYAYAKCGKNSVTDWIAERAQVRIIEKDSPEEAARKIREDEIDILFDLAGHTARTGLPILAYRPAPIQMSGIGYFDTTGLDAIDYFLTDELCDPPGQNDAYFTERLLRLPESHFCYMYHEKQMPPIGLLAVERQGHVTFGSFNNFRKMNDAVLRVWARILAAVPDSVLYVKAVLFETEEGREAGYERLERAGIARERVRMEKPEDEYLHCYEDVDIALDPWPYPGGGTTCDALYMGVPVVTLVGESHHRRFGYSLLKNVGLEELCAWNEEEYVEKAVALAHDLPRLNRLHQTLRAQMEQSPVMNGPRYMRNLEAAYTRIYGYWQDKQRVQEAARRRRPVLALTDEALPLLAAAFGEDVSSFSAERAAAMLDAQGIRLLMLGSERNLQLALPYDVTTHVYLFLLDGYPALRDALTEAGLVEHEQFFDGRCLLGGHPWISELRRVIQPQKFIEAL